MEQYHHHSIAKDPTVQDDPKAREILRRAFEKTARWPKEFKGFTADLICTVEGKETTGQVRVELGKDVVVTLPDAELQKWAQNQIAMMAVHRGPRSFEEADGRFSLTLGEEDHHPLGRLIFIHGEGMNSRYRVKDDRILQIRRGMSHMQFTINIEESTTTQDGKFLTTHYTVYYFQPGDGRLVQVDSFRDSHVRVGGADLPGTRRVISAENGQTVTRLLTFAHYHVT